MLDGLSGDRPLAILPESGHGVTLEGPKRIVVEVSALPGVRVGRSREVTSDGQSVFTDSLGTYAVTIPGDAHAVFDDTTAAVDSSNRSVTVDVVGVDTLDIDFTAIEYDLVCQAFAGGRPTAGRIVHLEAPPFVLDIVTTTDSLGAFGLTGRLVRSVCDSLRVRVERTASTWIGSCGSHDIRVGG